MPAARVFMLVRNPCTHDARVLKEADALARRGHRVVIIAVQRAGIPVRERRGGVAIVRVPINPWHYRFLRSYRGLARWEVVAARRKRRRALHEAWQERARTQAQRERIEAEAVRERERERLPELPSHLLPATAGRLGPSVAAPLRRAWMPVRVRLPSAARRRPARRLPAGPDPGKALVVPAARSQLAPARRPSGAVARARSSVRPAVYEALEWILLKGHRPFLLADYSRRALAVIEADLVTAGAGPVVVHAHDLNTLVPGVRARRRFGARLLYDSHELQMGTTGMVGRNVLQRGFYRSYERRLARRADAVITVCRSVADIMERTHRLPRVDVVRNCPLLTPPPGRQDLFRRELGIPAGHRVALYHGNLAPMRGLEVLIDSARRLDDVAVVLLGSGPLAADLPHLAKSLGVADRVHVLPAVAQDVLTRYVASADVAVVPIQGHVPNYRFSLPNKLFESMMAGLPVAASHLPEIRRVVESERVGAIFDPDDPADCARAIVAVLEAPDYEAMRARALRAARERHHWGREAQTLSAIYDTLTTASAPAHAAPDRRRPRALPPTPRPE